MSEELITCPKCKLQDPTHDVSIVQHRQPGMSLVGVGWRERRDRMGRMIINPKWIAKMNEIFAKGDPVVEVVSSTRVASWLITKLELMGYVYTIKNCGAGVRRIEAKKKE